MKRCPGCQMDIDKHTIACQYCGRLHQAEQQILKDDESVFEISKRKKRNFKQDKK